MQPVLALRNKQSNIYEPCKLSLNDCKTTEQFYTASHIKILLSEYKVGWLMCIYMFLSKTYIAWIKELWEFSCKQTYLHSSLSKPKCKYFILLFSMGWLAAATAWSFTKPTNGNLCREHGWKTPSLLQCFQERQGHCLRRGAGLQICSFASPVLPHSLSSLFWLCPAASPTAAGCLWASITLPNLKVRLTPFAICQCLGKRWLCCINMDFWAKMQWKFGPITSSLSYCHYLEFFE